MKCLLPVILLLVLFNTSYAQQGWSVCTAPVFEGRVDDIFMINADTGYAVCGDGKIVKTTDKANNWHLLLSDNNVYCRSVEFINERRGFVGGFWTGAGAAQKVLRKTVDGGTTWEDITALISPKARGGICGLAIPDENTVYGCGNWFQDSAYIIKSTDGGNSWNFINMGQYASSLIDMYFLNKDTGFVTGKSQTEKAVVLYTTDGGQNWSVKYHNYFSGDNGYVWKIQQLNRQVYFGSVESLTGAHAKIIKSTDGGMSWYDIPVLAESYNVEGTGFIDLQRGWTGGDHDFSLETTDGGLTWNRIDACPLMNRVWRVNDTMLLATGNKIWKYTTAPARVFDRLNKKYATMKCYPNPVNDQLTVEVWSLKATRISLVLYDNSGKRVRVNDNSNRQGGLYKYLVDTRKMAPGTYILVLKTHEETQSQKIIINH